jgi:dienelactone hydrolase
LDDGVAEDVRWQDERMEESGTVELDFVVERPTGVVPCAAWLPISPPPWPLVLVGHGGSGHKRSDRNVGLGRWFSSHAQIAVLAIDGPYHGDRVTAPLPAAVYQRRMLDEGLQAVTDRMTADWKDAIAALDSHGSVDTTRLGYFGLSMGTRLGIPLVASLGGDLRCAVLGKFGLAAAAGFYADADSTGIVAKCAPEVTTPTMFHVQLDDELFPLDGQLALFDLLGADEKLLLGSPGAHAESPPSAITYWRQFLALRLGATPQSAET